MWQWCWYSKQPFAGRRTGISEIHPLVRYRAAYDGNSLPIFRGNLSVPSTGFKTGPMSFPKMSIRYYHHTLRDNTEVRRFLLLRDRSLDITNWCYWLFSHMISEFYVYWTVHHLDSWIKRDQLDVTCFISLFNARHVSDVNVWRMLMYEDWGTNASAFIRIPHHPSQTTT